MKKIIAIAFAALLAGFAISCQKEEAFSDKTDAAQYTFNITVNDRVGFDNDASTKGGAPEYKTAWANGDRIFLFFSPTGGSLLNDRYATLTYNGSSWDGTVSSGQSSLGTGGTLSAVYVYNLGSDVKPEYSNGKWTISTGNVFYNCQTGVGYSISDNVISAILDLKAPLDFVRFRMMLSTDGPLTCNKVKGWKDVVIGSDMAIGNATCTGYMSGVAVSPGFREFYGRIVGGGGSLKNETCYFSIVQGSEVKEHIATPKSDARSFEMSINNWKAVPKNSLTGLFTIGKGADNTAGTADDVIVHFSQGNLYAKNEGTEGSPNWKWHFYDNQYQYNSNSTSQSRTAASTDNEIDLFTWGYDNDKSVNPIGNDGDNVSITSGNLSQAQDWGSQIGDGNTWRTLSFDEWRHLFNTRNASTVSGTANARYAKATVNNKTGIILLPDTYSHPSEVTALTKINTTDAAFNANNYGTEAWEKMETAGCVFLPAAGYRDGSNVNSVGNDCYYWSSSASGSDYAYGVDFYSGNVSFVQGYRPFGYSVRLITECQ